MGAKGFILKASAIAAFGLFSLQVSAATTGLEFAGGCPESIGTPCVPGSNATETNVALILGLDASLVTLVGVQESDLTPGPGFSVSGFGATDGDWTVTDTSITHLAFKSNGYYILGEVQAASGTWDNTDVGVGNTFGWDISIVDCPAAICGTDRAYTVDDFKNNGGNFADLSNVRAFTVVPVPAAVWLFGSGLLGLVGIARRRRA